MASYDEDAAAIAASMIAQANEAIERDVNWISKPPNSVGPRAKRLLPILDYQAMSTMPGREWLVAGVIQKNSSALLFGKSNSFKSFAAIDLALSVDTGLPWHGKDVSRGRVLIVATEGANGVGRLRIPSWYDFHGVAERDRQAFLYPGEICLDTSSEVEALIATMKEIGTFALVVVDIFGGSMKGSEIEDTTARAWVHGIQRILRETGASVLTVAHSGWNDDSRARMHTHFWGSFDSRLRMEGDKQALSATMSVERHKDADSSGKFGFRLERVGESLVPKFDSAVKFRVGRSQLSVAEHELMDALDTATKEYGTRRLGSDWPSVPVLHTDRWRDQYYQLQGNDPVKRKAFSRGKNSLKAKGTIAVFDNHVWRPP
jgi:hypothetical protein